MTVEKKKKSKLISFQDIIEVFLNSPPIKKSDWAIEMKTTTRLVKEYGLEFIFSLRGKKKVSSMLWFLTKEGKNFLKNAKATQKLEFKKEEYPLENESIAPETKVEIKPKTTKEFLKLFKNK